MAESGCAGNGMTHFGARVSIAFSGRQIATRAQDIEGHNPRTDDHATSRERKKRAVGCRWVAWIVAYDFHTPRA